MLKKVLKFDHLKKKKKKKKKTLGKVTLVLFVLNGPNMVFFLGIYNLDVYNILKSTVEMITTVEIKIIW